MSVLDFSCADEVVAKLIQRYLEPEPHEAFFVFRGVHEPHRDQVAYVLERQGLLAVAETAPGAFELLGARTDGEERTWRALERLRFVPPPEHTDGRAPEGVDPEDLEALVRRRVAFRSPVSGRVHALSHLVRQLL